MLKNLESIIVKTWHAPTRWYNNKYDCIHQYANDMQIYFRLTSDIHKFISTLSESTTLALWMWVFMNFCRDKIKNSTSEIWFGYLDLLSLKIKDYIRKWWVILSLWGFGVFGDLTLKLNMAQSNLRLHDSVR